MTWPEPSVGFVVLSHGDPALLVRLISILNKEYGRPRIAVHHDIHQNSIDMASFPSNVLFVEPVIKTGWAKHSIVRAALAGLDLLYRDATPEWFFIISAADYPLRSGRDVLSELKRSPYDAYLDVRPLDDNLRGHASFFGRNNVKLSHFDQPGNIANKRRFYLASQLWFPIIRLDPTVRVGKYTIRYNWKYTKTPFNHKFHALYGDFWFCANRKSARILLSDSNNSKNLKEYYKDRTQTDESYFQTILGNESSLNISLDNRRYAEWNGGGAHPQLLEPRNVEAAFSSGAFFARKFALNSTALDVIDHHLAALRQVASSVDNTGAAGIRRRHSRLATNVSVKVRAG